MSWGGDEYGFIYDTIIIELPSSYSGSYYVGKHYTAPEKRIVGKRYSNQYKQEGKL